MPPSMTAVCWLSNKPRPPSTLSRSRTPKVSGRCSMLKTTKSTTTPATLILTQWSLLDEKEKCGKRSTLASHYSGDASSVIPLSRDLSVVPLFCPISDALGPVYGALEARYRVAVHPPTTLVVVAGPHFSYRLLTHSYGGVVPCYGRYATFYSTISFCSFGAAVPAFCLFPYTPTMPPLSVSYVTPRNCLLFSSRSSV